ncbi:MAG: RNA polymerase sigma-I factor [Gorillibacterium sp.]|nr:RNA polymerase sigma-I factor [Gorillibacterium sp.]
MLDRSTEQFLRTAQEGNAVDRGWLVEQYRPFVIRTVSHICKRQIGWNHDEASIGLIAFNEAIDRYNVAHGKTFDNFAYMIIHSRLVDEFRKQGKVLRIESVVFNDVHDEFDQTSSEIASSMETYEREQLASEIAQELTLYDELLQEYGISLEDLEDCSPKHRDARKQLIQIAKRFCEKPEWVTVLRKTKRLPIKEMLRLLAVSPKKLERNRKYLIALVLIYTYEGFERIRSSVSFADIEE